MTHFSSNQRLTPSGQLIVDHTNNVNGFKALSIEATEDTVISVCTGINGENDTTVVNFKTDARYNWLNLKAGDIVSTEGDEYITSITLTSGRLIVNKA